jgi:hypothetical protein
MGPNSKSCRPHLFLFPTKFRKFAQRKTHFYEKTQADFFHCTPCFLEYRFFFIFEKRFHQTLLFHSTGKCGSIHPHVLFLLVVLCIGAKTFDAQKVTYFLYNQHINCYIEQCNRNVGSGEQHRALLHEQYGHTNIQICIALGISLRFNSGCLLHPVR